MKKSKSRFIKLEYGFLYDDKVMDLTDMEGPFGIGVLVGFWQIQGEQEESGYKVSRDRLGSKLARMVNTSKQEVERIIELLLEIGLIVEDKEGLYSERLREELEEMDAKIQRLQKLNPSGVKTDTQEGTHMGTLKGSQEDTQETTHSRARVLENKSIRDIDNKEKLSKESKEKRFSKPTLLELIEFIMTNNLNIDAERFMDYYESNGWMVGKNHMKNWKATARRWSREEMKKPEAPRNGMARDYTGQFDYKQPEEIEI